MLSPIEMAIIYGILPVCSMFIIVRTNWVDRNRIALYNKMTMDEMVDFDQTYYSFLGMTIRIWVWNITKLKRPTK